MAKKKAVKVQLNDIVLVKWIDAHSSYSHWIYVDDIEYEYDFVVQSVGIVTYIDKNKICITQSLSLESNDEEDGQQCHSMLTIPSVWLDDIKVLGKIQ